MTTPKSSPFVSELLRLNAEQVAAKARGDQEAYEAATHEMALIWRYNATGRLEEYFASREAAK